MVVQITKASTAAAIALVTVAIVVTQSATGWAQTNSAPIIATPSSTSLQYLFPRGAATTLSFPSAPATDSDGDDITYRFVFTVPDTSTTDEDDTREVIAADALFTVNRNGNAFAFDTVPNVTPKQFNDLYGDVVSHTVLVKMYANDGAQDSESLSFNIRVFHDASPQFHLAAAYQGKQRWTLDQEITVHEGPAANAELAAIILGDYDENGQPRPGQPTRLENAGDALQIPWTAASAGTRTWTRGNRDGAANSPKIECLDHDGATTHTWDDAGSEDSLQFGLETPAQNGAGHVALKFSSEPDYESPGDDDQDNTYLVRLVNDHDIHGLGDDDATLGCDGSAVDVAITVKDVGPPAPIEDFTVTLEEMDDGYTVNMRWDNTRLNRFIENGDYVDFPDPYFPPDGHQDGISDRKGNANHLDAHRRD